MADAAERAQYASRNSAAPSHEAPVAHELGECVAGEAKARGATPHRRCPMPDTNFPKPGPAFDAGHVPITEEFDSVKRSLPPVATLVAALVVVVVFIVGVAYIFRAKPVAQGQIDRAFAMQQQDKPYSMVLMQVTLRNVGDKTLYIKDIKSDITTEAGASSDQAASAVDFSRYLQAFPDLQMYATEPLKVETKIPPGGEAQG